MNPVQAARMIALVGPLVTGCSCGPEPDPDTGPSETGPLDTGPVDTGGDPYWPTCGEPTPVESAPVGMVELGTADVQFRDDFLGAFAYGDANGDGCADMALQSGQRALWVAGPGERTMYLEEGGWAAVFPALEEGDGTGDPLAVGDFDGDGLDDLAVGARYGGPFDLGAAYIVYSTVSGEFDLADSDATLLGSGKYTPAAMSSGDIDGDGLDDLALTYRPYSTMDDQEGKVYLTRGPITGTWELSDAESIIVDDEQTESFSSFGRHASLRGDFDGDGLSDLAVTAQDRGRGELGAVYVMFAPFAERSYISDADVCFTGGGGSMGFDLSTGGDVNGDGYDDLMAGTYLQSTGYAYLLLGPLDDGSYTTSTLDGKLSLTESLAYFGRNLSIEQDLNGDGRDDVAVGARNSNLYTPQVGTTFIFYDAPLGHVDAGEADAFVHSETHMEFDLSNGMGTVVESTGDMNGDGYEELLIGSVSNYYFYVLFGGPT